MLSIALTIAASVVGLGIPLIEKLTALAPLAEAPNPYFLPDQASFLYLIVPLITLSACALFAAPGLLMALALGERNFGSWLLKGFAFSLILVSATAALVQCLMPGVLRGYGFFWTVIALNAVAVLAASAADGNERIVWTMFSGRSADIVAMIATPFVVLLLLSAKFYWEDFNGDGAHALQGGRLIMIKGLPFWPEGAGAVGTYPSVQAVLPSLQISWFLRLFGETEFAVRMQYLLGLPFLAGITLEFIRMDRSHPAVQLRWAAAGIAFALLLYSFVLAFNASYDPYFADIALPMAREPLVMIAFLGFAYFYLRDQKFWIVLFAILNYTAAPGGLALMTFLVIAVWVSTTPRPWLRSGFGFAALLGAALFGMLLQWAVLALSIGSPSEEFGVENILQRMRFVSFGDWQRLPYWIVPCGVVPALALAAWGWQDRIARIFAVTAIVYVAFFSLQGYRVLLNHFAPAMIMPLIVFWRLKVWESVAGRRLGLASASVGLAAGAVLSAPPSWQPHTYASSFGAAIRIDGSRYSQLDPIEFDAAHELLGQAFPIDHSEAGAAKRYQGSPLAWYTYAVRPKRPGTRIYYVMCSSAAEKPSGASAIATHRGWTLYALDAERYRLDQLNPGLVRTINPVYYVDRDELFGSGERWGDRIVRDLANFLPWKKD